MPRFYCAQSLDTGALVDLPAAAARHVQVLRMQPGQALTLFNGAGGEWDAVIAHMGRQEVRVVVGGHHPLDRESSQRVHLAVVMPANDRMDWLVEKATELGVDRITPLMSQRSVLRLQGERAEKKVAHWQAVAISACEQCGRNTVPKMDKLQTVPAWLAANPWQTGGEGNPTPLAPAHAAVLSLHADTQSMATWVAACQSTPPAQDVSNIAKPRTAYASGALGASWIVLNGPEGGLTDEEDALARARGFAAVHLGQRVLRAETAALAALAYLNISD